MNMARRVWNFLFKNQLGVAMKRKYDYVPDLPDHRDYGYGEHGFRAAVVPRHVDLRGGCSAIKYQGQLGSCTGNSLAGAVEFETRRAGRKPPDLSRLFIYYCERAIEHTTRSDSGAQIRDGIKALATQGVCPESEWPYVIAHFRRKPTLQDYKDAAAYKIGKYMRLASRDDMVNCLAAGFPFVFGFSVYESFESAAVAQTGVVPMPAKTERCLGGHAVYAVGYNLDTDTVLVANSWGTGWGQSGFFTMPFAYLLDTNLAEDFWCLQA
jgi:C1A family cysteine protease